MRHLPDGEYKWILHAIDHWTKFNFAFPLQSKEAESVAVIFRTYIFPYFGIPKIFHTDNGRELANSIIENLNESWQSDIQIIHGWQCHPQTQGVIELAHRTLEQKLGINYKERSRVLDRLRRLNKAPLQHY